MVVTFFFCGRGCLAAALAPAPDVTTVSVPQAHTHAHTLGGSLTFIPMYTFVFTLLPLLNFISHDRLAVVGYLVTYAGVRFPGAEDIPSGFAALDNLPGMVWAQMIATWTMMEAANQDQFKAPWGTGDGPTEADFKGDFRNGALDFGWSKQSDEWKMRKRAIELNQGRAAQMGILGLMVHEKLGNIDTILPLGPH